MKDVGGRAGAARVICAAFVLAVVTVGGLSAQEEAPEPYADRRTGGGLTLPRAVGMALERNQELVGARATLREAEERVSEAWGNLYPSVDLSMTYTRNVSPAVNFLPAIIFDPDAPADEQIAVQFGADNTWNGLIDVEQALFRPAVFVGVGAAGRFQELQDEVVRGRVQSVVTRVRLAYYDLLLAREQARLTENSLERVRETLRETKAMNRAGLSSDYDVLRLEVEVANLEPELLRARNAIRSARRELGVLLDLEAMEDVEVAGSLATMDLDDPTANVPANRQILAFTGTDLERIGEPDGVPVQVLVQRSLEGSSDVRQAELNENLRQAQLRLEQVEYLPEVSLFGSYQVSSSQNGDPSFFGRPRAYSRRVGVQVTLPVFTGLQRDARIDQKNAVLRSARAEIALARDRVESEVRTRVDQTREARARARGQRLAVTQAERGFEIARAQYREGLGSQLEITDAEVALRESEFNYAQAVYDFLAARARLDEAVGRVPLVDAASVVGRERSREARR